MTTPRSTLHRLAACAATVAFAFGLAACSSAADGTEATSGSTTGTPDANATLTEPPAAQADDVTVTDAWVKAADSGMTGMFATVTNEGTEPVGIVGAASELSPVEIHEMATDDSGATVMRAKEGGVEVPAGGSVTFEPGGDHLMLMELAEPVLAGGAYVVTLSLADGSTVDVIVEGRTYAGAQEDYAG